MERQVTEALLQEVLAVWDVVNFHPYSGVAIPEPAAVGALAALASIALRRPHP